MDFTLNEEHRLIRNTVRDFAENEIKPKATELDEKEEFSLDLTRKMGEIGLFGITVPSEYGGQGLDYLAYIIAVEELARVDGSQAATVAAHNSLGIGPIYYFGTEEQKRRILPRLCTGEALWSFGLTEPDAGSDSRGSKTTAKKVDGGWVINGSKIFITNGSNPLCIGSTVQCVTAREGGKPEFTCFIVETGTPGFTARAMHHKLMWRSSDTAELVFEDCFVPDGNMLGARGAGSKQMLATLDSGRLSIAAMGLGCAQGAFEVALEYAEAATAVRPADRQVPGQQLQAGGHGAEVRARPHTPVQGLLAAGYGPALREGGGHVQALLFGSRGPGGRRGGPAARGIRIDEGLSRGEVLPRSETLAHRRRHLGNSANGHCPSDWLLTAPGPD